MSSAFDADSTTSEVLQGHDLKGKTVVVTGGSAGLGLETGRALAASGARVAMMARNPEKLEQALQKVRQDHPETIFEARKMDLADLSSVRAAAEQLLADHPRIDVLINNAGIMACPLARTADGFELQLATNHLGHFVFTCRLVPALLAAAPSRVVVLSSSGHKRGGINFDDPNFERRDYDKWLAYGQAKTANALFAVGLHKRLSRRGVTANAVHPGLIVTELGRHLDASDISALQSRVSSRAQIFKSVEAGAATSVWAAVSPDLEGRGGLYLEDCQVADGSSVDTGTGYAPYALDPELADKLWNLSEELVGEHFNWD